MGMVGAAGDREVLHNSSVVANLTISGTRTAGNDLSVHTPTAIRLVRA